MAPADSVQTLEDSIERLGFQRVSLARVRDFTIGGSGTEQTFAGVERWLLSAVETLSACLPVPRTVAPFVERPFFRPPWSSRSFYYSPATLQGSSTDAGRAVVALKGLEPCISDVDDLFRDLRRASYSPHNIAEHFVFVEHKIPGCLGLAEAIREAEQAAAIQERHLRFYGSLARLPVPLFVYRHSDEVVERVTERLRRLLGAAAFERIEPTLAGGLGAYVYYYPTAPIRARDIDHALENLSFQERLVVLLRDVCDPEDVILGWVRGFTRMLYLGFLPGSLASLRSGICCQPQNACLDGGFVDLDSLTPLDELQDTTALNAALQFCVESLLQTMRSLTAGGVDPTRPEGNEIRIDLHYIRQYLLGAIKRAIETEARAGLQLDTRIAAYFFEPKTFEELVIRLRPYFGGSSEFETVNEEFHHLSRELLKGLRGS
jgi:hypothetical protein